MVYFTFLLKYIIFSAYDLHHLYLSFKTNVYPFTLRTTFIGVAEIHMAFIMNHIY